MFGTVWLMPRRESMDVNWVFPFSDSVCVEVSLDSNLALDFYIDAEADKA